MWRLPDDSVSWFKIFKSGQNYMKTWPTEKSLAPVFPENRVVRATYFGLRFMPAVTVFTLSWQITLGGPLGPAVATAIFACSLPMQGLWWLGKRSVTPLPAALLSWFHEVRQKLSNAGQSLAPVENVPDYQMLAELLKRALKLLDKTFLDDF